MADHPVSKLNTLFSHLKSVSKLAYEVVKIPNAEVDVQFCCTLSCPAICVNECTVEPQIFQALGRSKKIAQKNAAYKALEQLQEVTNLMDCNRSSIEGGVKAALSTRVSTQQTSLIFLLLTFLTMSRSCIMFFSVDFYPGAVLTQTHALWMNAGSSNLSIKSVLI